MDTSAKACKNEGLQTVDAYSNSGLIKDMYARIRASTSLDTKQLNKTYRPARALRVMVAICNLKLREESMSTPRSRIEVTVAKV